MQARFSNYGHDSFRRRWYRGHKANPKSLPKLQSDGDKCNDGCRNYKKAKDAGVKSYIQKPIDEDEFNSAIDKLFAGEELYRLLSENYFGAFRESLISYLKRLEASPLVQNEEQTNENIKSKKSSGISVTIGIIGRHCGRLVIDMSDDTIIELAKRALNKSELAKDEMIAFLESLGI